MGQNPLSKKHRRFLNMAFEVARDSTLRCMHGAVLVKNGNVIAVAANRLRNDPRFVEDSDDKSSIHSYHAEIMAIKRANTSLVGATIYVARAKHGKPSFSRPCNNCYEAIRDAGVKEIIYT